MQMRGVPVSAPLRQFEPASTEQMDWLVRQFPAFHLDEYLEVLRETNGLGEVFAEAVPPFVHNMLLFSVEEALDVSETDFKSTVLAIGRPGFDGIVFVLQPGGAHIYAYYPIDEEFREVASSLHDLLSKWVVRDLHL